jgi:hypothetical protein
MGLARCRGASLPTNIHFELRAPLFADFLPGDGNACSLAELFEQALPFKARNSGPTRGLGHNSKGHVAAVLERQAVVKLLPPQYF